MQETRRQVIRSGEQRERPKNDRGRIAKQLGVEAGSAQTKTPRKGKRPRSNKGANLKSTSDVGGVSQRGGVSQSETLSQRKTWNEDIEIRDREIKKRLTFMDDFSRRIFGETNAVYDPRKNDLWVQHLNYFASLVQNDSTQQGSVTAQQASIDNRVSYASPKNASPRERSVDGSNSGSPDGRSRRSGSPNGKGKNPSLNSKDSKARKEREQAGKVVVSRQSRRGQSEGGSSRDRRVSRGNSPCGSEGRREDHQSRDASADRRSDRARSRGRTGGRNQASAASPNPIPDVMRREMKIGDRSYREHFLYHPDKPIEQFFKPALRGMNANEAILNEGFQKVYCAAMISLLMTAKKESFFFVLNSEVTMVCDCQREILVEKEQSVRDRKELAALLGGDIKDGGGKADGKSGKSDGKSEKVGSPEKGGAEKRSSSKDKDSAIAEALLNAKSDNEIWTIYQSMFLKNKMLDASGGQLALQGKAIMDPSGKPNTNPTQLGSQGVSSTNIGGNQIGGTHLVGSLGMNPGMSATSNPGSPVSGQVGGSPQSPGGPVSSPLVPGSSPGSSLGSPGQRGSILGQPGLSPMKSPNMAHRRVSLVGDWRTAQGSGGPGATKMKNLILEGVETLKGFNLPSQLCVPKELNKVKKENRMSLKSEKIVFESAEYAPSKVAFGRGVNEENVKKKRNLISIKQVNSSLIDSLFPSYSCRYPLFATRGRQNLRHLPPHFLPACTRAQFDLYKLISEFQNLHVVFQEYYADVSSAAYQIFIRKLESDLRVFELSYLRFEKIFMLCVSEMYMHHGKPYNSLKNMTQNFVDVLHGISTMELQPSANFVDVLHGGTSGGTQDPTTGSPFSPTQQGTISMMDTGLSPSPVSPSGMLTTSLSRTSPSGMPLHDATAMAVPAIIHHTLGGDPSSFPINTNSVESYTFASDLWNTLEKVRNGEIDLDERAKQIMAAGELISKTIGEVDIPEHLIFHQATIQLFHQSVDAQKAKTYGWRPAEERDDGDYKADEEQTHAPYISPQSSLKGDGSSKDDKGHTDKKQYLPGPHGSPGHNHGSPGHHQGHTRGSPGHGPGGFDQGDHSFGNSPFPSGMHQEIENPTVTTLNLLQKKAKLVNFEFVELDLSFLCQDLDQMNRILNPRIAAEARPTEFKPSLIARAQRVGLCEAPEPIVHLADNLLNKFRTLCNNMNTTVGDTTAGGLTGNASGLTGKGGRQSPRSKTGAPLASGLNSPLKPTIAQNEQRAKGEQGRSTLDLKYDLQELEKLWQRGEALLSGRIMTLMGRIEVYMRRNPKFHTLIKVGVAREAKRIQMNDEEFLNALKREFLDDPFQHLRAQMEDPSGTNASQPQEDPGGQTTLIYGGGAGFGGVTNIQYDNGVTGYGGTNIIQYGGGGNQYGDKNSILKNEEEEFDLEGYYQRCEIALFVTLPILMYLSELHSGGDIFEQIYSTKGLKALRSEIASFDERRFQVLYHFATEAETGEADKERDKKEKEGKRNTNNLSPGKNANLSPRNNANGGNTGGMAGNRTIDSSPETRNRSPETDRSNGKAKHTTVVNKEKKDKEREKSIDSANRKQQDEEGGQRQYFFSVYRHVKEVASFLVNQRFRWFYMVSKILEIMTQKDQYVHKTLGIPLQ